MAQCKAMSKRTGERCRHGAVGGREVCKWHGGDTPRGPASPHFKDGCRSRFWPCRIAARCEEIRRDARLFDLRQEIALCDYRIAELLSRAEGKAEDSELWAEVAKQIDLRGKTVDREVRRLLTFREVLTAEEAMAMFSEMTRIVTEHVKDSDTLAAISNDVERLAARVEG